jgi:hypothetical protein
VHCSVVREPRALGKHAEERIHMAPACASQQVVLRPWNGCTAADNAVHQSTFIYQLVVLAGAPGTPAYIRGECADTFRYI